MEQPPDRSRLRNEGKSRGNLPKKAGKELEKLQRLVPVPGNAGNDGKIQALPDIPWITGIKKPSGVFLTSPGSGNQFPTELGRRFSEFSSWNEAGAASRSRECRDGAELDFGNVGSCFSFPFPSRLSQRSRIIRLSPITWECWDVGLGMLFPDFFQELEAAPELFFPFFSHLEPPYPGISGNFVFPASGICWGCNPREIPRFPEPEFPSFGASGEGIDLPVFYPPGPGIPGNFPWKRPARGDSGCGKRGWKSRNWAGDPKIWDWPLRLRKSGSCCGRKIPEGGREELFYSRDLAAPGSRERLGRARSSLGRGKVSHGMGWDRIPSAFRDSVPRSRIPQEEPEPGHSVRSQLWGFFGNSGRFQLE